ncbi:uncharacterized protein LOC106155736 [Lingula anatina]|uniref:Uncharacterized protein LOC106155736 n=1 Tax=Lingula anatina TaxID=7574 RepID=A0A1S3HL24_LINAN|nr:uncharacterized protein LOC106155736 [Lingula anatina]XP_013386161.1 uncharacterized protein LOC106155736 [Lingula anatina]XP_013386162.1 uncharacterized protein LOC106155736 [Lingula anatina]XP_013386163.1 uncharacterized protein LOC106155736 [Lingula anatina]XP_013386164.1 uncharacterized protein LOC106155736 [Lingula anatina]XP_013386165.1 uncharacterized protein LOC106155736 [Lingula anatina]|eukprot:XP_013386160.1 uncharacterized protein LOC106155736 [Lingula anatina]
MEEQEITEGKALPSHTNSDFDNTLNNTVLDREEEDKTDAGGVKVDNTVDNEVVKEEKEEQGDDHPVEKHPVDRAVDRAAKSEALEKEYVHDVYEKIAPHFSDARYKAWPKVKQFIEDLEPGALVADIGCGNGKYLGINSSVYKLGTDRCARLVEIAAEHGHQTMVSDSLLLPYRDNVFDAVISIAVIHHFSTIERRIQAIRELARICQIGGKVMIYVWAMEQTKRKFESQDVLVPWHLHPKYKHKKEKKKKNSSIENDLPSSSSISEDETQGDPVAMTITSESDIVDNDNDTNGSSSSQHDNMLRSSCRQIQEWCKKKRGSLSDSTPEHASMQDNGEVTRIQVLKYQDSSSFEGEEEPSFNCLKHAWKKDRVHPRKQFQAKAFTADQEDETSFTNPLDSMLESIKRQINYGAIAPAETSKQSSRTSSPQRKKKRHPKLAHTLLLKDYGSTDSETASSPEDQQCKIRFSDLIKTKLKSILNFRSQSVDEETLMGHRMKPAPTSSSWFSFWYQPENVSEEELHVVPPVDKAEIDVINADNKETISLLSQSVDSGIQSCMSKDMTTATLRSIDSGNSSGIQGSTPTISGSTRDVLGSTTSLPIAAEKIRDGKEHHRDAKYSELLRRIMKDWNRPILEHSVSLPEEDIPAFCVREFPLSSTRQAPQKAYSLDTGYEQNMAKNSNNLGPGATGKHMTKEARMMEEENSEASTSSHDSALSLDRPSVGSPNTEDSTSSLEKTGLDPTAQQQNASLTVTTPEIARKDSSEEESAFMETYKYYAETLWNKPGAGRSRGNRINSDSSDDFSEKDDFEIELNVSGFVVSLQKDMDSYEKMQQWKDLQWRFTGQPPPSSSTKEEESASALDEVFSESRLFDASQKKGENLFWQLPPNSSGLPLLTLSKPSDASGSSPLFMGVSQESDVTITDSVSEKDLSVDPTRSGKAPSITLSDRNNSSSNGSNGSHSSYSQDSDLDSEPSSTQTVICKSTVDRLDCLSRNGGSGTSQDSDDSNGSSSRTMTHTSSTVTPDEDGSLPRSRAHSADYKDMFSSFLELQSSITELERENAEEEEKLEASVQTQDTDTVKVIGEGIQYSSSVDTKPVTTPDFQSATQESDSVSSLPRAFTVVLEPAQLGESTTEKTLKSSHEICDETSSNVQYDDDKTNDLKVKDGAVPEAEYRECAVVAEEHAKAVKTGAGEDTSTTNQHEHSTTESVASNTSYQKTSTPCIQKGQSDVQKESMKKHETVQSDNTKSQEVPTVSVGLVQSTSESKPSYESQNLHQDTKVDSPTLKSPLVLQYSTSDDVFEDLPTDEPTQSHNVHNPTTELLKRVVFDKQRNLAGSSSDSSSSSSNRSSVSSSNGSITSSSNSSSSSGRTSALNRIALRRRSFHQTRQQAAGSTDSVGASSSTNSSVEGAKAEPTYQRYYHVFRERELIELIEEHVDSLHIISSYYDHANWCVIAEKVQVWTL